MLHELPLLRLRALLARARDDEPGYQLFLERFRAQAAEADFEGYLAQAEAMASALQCPRQPRQPCWTTFDSPDLLIFGEPE